MCCEAKGASWLAERSGLASVEEGRGGGLGRRRDQKDSRAQGEAKCHSEPGLQGPLGFARAKAEPWHRLRGGRRRGSWEAEVRAEAWVSTQLATRSPETTSHPTSSLLGLPPALGPDTCPVSPPSPLEVPTPKAPQPKVHLPWSPGDLLEKGKGRWLEGVGGSSPQGAVMAPPLPSQKSWQGAWLRP